MLGRTRIVPFLLALIAATESLAAASSAGPEVPFYEGFEWLPEGSVDGRGGWSVSAGEASVVADCSRFGERSLRAGEGCEVALGVENSQNLLWVDMWIITAGGPLVPAVPPQPKKSAVLAFDCLDGIQALDGDGMGGGVLVNSGVVLAGDRWHRVTVKLDFDVKRWELYVDGLLRLTDLGFHSRDVAGLSGMVRTACAQSHLDALSFSGTGLMDDTDRDGLADLDEMKVYGTDPSSPDTDGDGMRDGDEIVAGTQPTDGESFFQLRISAQNGASVFQLSALTVEGKTYQLQATEEISDPDSWYPAADFEGDGLPWTFAVSDHAGAAMRFYRLVVFPW